MLTSGYPGVAAPYGAPSLYPGAPAMGARMGPPAMSHRAPSYRPEPIQSKSGLPYMTEVDDEPTDFWESFVQDRWTQHYYIRAKQTPGALSMTGTPYENETLTAQGWWIAMDERDCRYQWSARHMRESTWRDIPGATQRSYRVRRSDEDCYLRCTVTHEGDKNSVDTKVPVEVTPAPVAAPAPEPVAAPAPTRVERVDVHGGPHHTNVLVCKVTWTPPTAPEPRGRAVWLRCEQGESTYTPIPGATEMSYRPTADDLHCQLKCEYTELNDNGTPGRMHSIDVNETFLNIDPQIAQAVQDNVHAGTKTFKVRDANNGADVDIFADAKTTKVVNGKTVSTGTYLNWVRCNLSYTDPDVFTLELGSAKQELRAADIRERDEIALTVRSFLGIAVLSNDNKGIHRTSSLTDLHPPQH